MITKVETYNKEGPSFAWCVKTVNRMVAECSVGGDGYGQNAITINDIFTRQAIINELIKSGYHVETQGNRVYFSWSRVVYVPS